MARRLFGDTALHQRFDVGGVGAQPLLELLESAFEQAALTIGDLEIPTRDVHALIERQRARKCDDGFVGQPLPEVEDTEIVVCPRVRWIDTAGKRTQDVDLTAMRGCHWAGSCRCAHETTLRAPRGRWRRKPWDRERAGRIRA